MKHHQPIASGPWWLKFIYSRNKFSPRLLAAWLLAAYTVRVIEHALGQKAFLLGAVLVQPQDFTPLIVTMVGGVLALFGYGTIQTVALGDIAPATGVAAASQPLPDAPNE